MTWTDTKVDNASELTASEYNAMVAYILTNTQYGPILQTPSATEQYSGIVRSGTAGENVAFGDLVYLKSDGKFWKTDSDAAATTRGKLAIATATILADATGVFLIYGYARKDTWAYTVAADLYVSGTLGEITETQPVGTGKIVRTIGQAYSATTVFFNPDNTYIELT